jgi:hypothetical protein
MGSVTVLFMGTEVQDTIALTHTNILIRED